MATIKPVVSKKDLKRFITFPYSFYKEDTYWIPPLRLDQSETLNPKKNPFFEHGKIQCFLAENEEGNIIGRIAAIINGMHLKKYDDANGFFGFFECIEDETVARQLLEVAQTWLQEQGMKGMRGPVNPSMNDVAGLLVDGFDRYPSIMMPYNKPYYEAHLLNFGFQRVMTMWAYYIHFKYRNDMERIKRGVDILYRRYPTLKMRTLDMKNFDRDANIILDIYNEAWSDNWGHVSMTEHEFDHLAKSLKQIVDPNVVFILELDGKPIAFSITLPNINLYLKHIPNGKLLPTGILQLLIRSKFQAIHEGRTLLMGVRKEFQGKGFDSIVNLAILFDGPANGYESSEISWVLDSNKPMVNAAIRMGATKDKEYAMFEKIF